MATWKGGGGHQQPEHHQKSTSQKYPKCIKTTQQTMTPYCNLIFLKSTSSLENCDLPLASKTIHKKKISLKDTEEEKFTYYKLNLILGNF